MNKSNGENVQDNAQKFETIFQNQEFLNRFLAEELCKLRKGTIRLIKSANMANKERRKELIKLNEEICELQGHTYTKWKEQRDALEGTLSYSRRCKICNSINQVQEKPNDYEVKQLKKLPRK